MEQQVTMDMDFLEKGHSYRELPDGIIIFLCTFDPLGLGKAKYVFRDICDTDGDGNFSLCNGTEKIFFNCTCPLEYVPKKLSKIRQRRFKGKIYCFRLRMFTRIIHYRYAFPLFNIKDVPNNCILADLSHGTSRASFIISQEVSKIASINSNQRRKKLSCRPMLEFVCLLYVYK